jgi:hypothetical protein
MTQKNSPSKLLDSVNSFSNVAGYKINLQKSVDFLYTNSEQIEKEYRKTTPVKIAQKSPQICKSKFNRGHK